MNKIKQLLSSAAHALAIVVLAVSSSNVSAQEQTNYAGSSRFFDNWSIGIGGGISTNLNEWNKPRGGHVNLELSRQITPIWSVGMDTRLGFNDQVNFDGIGYAPTVVDNVLAGLHGTFNLSNALFGYQCKPRVFETAVRMGVGYAKEFSSTFEHSLYSKYGIDFNINIGHKRAWTVSVRPSVTFVHCMGNFNSRFAVFNADAMLVYHFNTSNGQHYISKAKLYDQAEVDMLNDKINDMNQLIIEKDKENAFLKGMLTECERARAEQEKQAKEVSVQYETVKFKKESFSIENPESIDTLANQVKESGDKFVIIGYASIDGPVNYNYILSKKRAMTVYNELVKRGCDAKQLRVVAGGETDRFSVTEYEKNRIVISEIDTH